MRVFSKVVEISKSPTTERNQVCDSHYKSDGQGMLLVDYIERGHSINERYNGDKLTAGLHIRSLVGCVHGYGYQLADLPPYSADKLAYGYCKMELNCHHFLTDYDVIKAEGSLSHLLQ